MRSFVCLALLAVLGGCSPATSSSNTPTTLKPEDYVKAGSTGEFVSTSTANLGPDGSVPPDMVLPGSSSCSHVGPQFDSRIRVGDKIVTRSEDANDEVASAVTTTTQATAFDGTRLDVLGTLSDLSATGVSVPSESQYTFECTLRDGCAMPAFTEGKPPSLPSKNCRISDQTMGAHTIGTVELGTFTLRSGVSVPAQRIIQTTVGGTIVCREDGSTVDKVLGSGVQIIESIETVGLVTFDEFNCAPISHPYTMTTLKLDSGPIVSLSKSEIL